MYVLHTADGFSVGQILDFELAKSRDQCTGVLMPVLGLVLALRRCTAYPTAAEAMRCQINAIGSV
jgi:hypothetical protein